MQVVEEKGNSIKSDVEIKMSHLSDILQEKLEKAYHKQTSSVSLHDIAKIAVEHSAIDLAFAVTKLPPNARPVLYDNLPDFDAKINFLINTDVDTRLKIFRYMNDKELKEIFEKMATNDAVRILEDVSQRRFKRILELIDQKKAHRIKELKKHQRNSAGRLMTSEFFAFTMDVPIGDVASYIRDNPRIDFSKGIYVLGEDRKLQGYVPSRNLVINPPELPLKQVMRPVLYKVAAIASREEVVDIVEKYKVSSLPVVDSEDRLIGVIAYEDVVEAMEDLADETIAQMAGTEEKIFTYDSLLKRFWARSPWLLVTLLGGMINVGIMNAFEKGKSGIWTILLFFVPLITGMSGNVGIQCSTVLVRSMAVGAISPGNRKTAVRKEIVIGLLAGLLFGVCCGILVSLINFLTGYSLCDGLFSLGAIVSIGLLGACFFGTLLGVFSPLFFSRIGIDPAISSGPIVTALNDILSMTIYFLIAWGLGTLLFG